MSGPCVDRVGRKISWMCGSWLRWRRWMSPRRSCLVLLSHAVRHMFWGDVAFPILVSAPRAVVVGLGCCRSDLDRLDELDDCAGEMARRGVEEAERAETGAGGVDFCGCGELVRCYIDFVSQDLGRCWVHIRLFLARDAELVIVVDEEVMSRTHRTTAFICFISAATSPLRAV